jgi:hypothetical protein
MKGWMDGKQASKQASKVGSLCQFHVYRHTRIILTLGFGVSGTIKGLMGGI